MKLLLHETKFRPKLSINFIMTYKICENFWKCTYVYLRVSPIVDMSLEFHWIIASAEYIEYWMTLSHNKYIINLSIWPPLLAKI